jgi:hypothetical protein
VLAELQYSKDDIAFSLHANPTTFSMSGLQRADLLHLLGFEKGNCPFFPGGECFAKWATYDFPLQEFADSIPKAFAELETAERHLTQFGLLLRGQSPSSRSTGDGHSSVKTEELKREEDEYFEYVLSWLDGGGQKGWSFHHHPIHPPLTDQVKAVFKFLGLEEFDGCPYFEFEPCHWQFFPFRHDSRSMFDSNAQVVNDTFAKLSAHFSQGIESLVLVHSAFEEYGFEFLPAIGHDVSIAPQELSPAPLSEVLPPSHFEFDVAISFAGPQRSLAEALAKYVEDAGFTPFYDDYYPEQLWGKDLVVFFDEIYRERSRFCVIFVSKDYSERMWTNHERRSAQARALEEKGNEYILPIKVDDSELPGMPPTIGYVSLDQNTIEEIASLLINKLKSG